MTRSAKKVAGSRGPNTTPFPFNILGDTAFKVVSWNTQGLAVKSPIARARSFEYLRKLSYNRHIICLQEVHGLEEEVLAAVRSNLPGWGCFHSPTLNPDGIFAGGKAGVAILICPVITQVARTIHRVLVPGRAQLANIVFPGGDSEPRTLSILNVHNFGLSRSMVLEIGAVVDDLVARDASQPHKSTSMLVGDLNCRHPRDPPLVLGQTAPSLRILAAPAPSGFHVGLWKGIVGNLIELHQTMPTHFASASRTLTRIDYGFTTSPGSLLIRMQVSASVLLSPDTCYYRELSDHGPLEFSFAPKAARPVGDRALPKLWTSHPAFAERLQMLAEEVKFNSLHTYAPLERLRLYKVCIRSAALHVRDVLHYTGSNDTEHRRLVLEALARCIWKNDTRTARTLLEVSHIARETFVFRKARYDHWTLGNSRTSTSGRSGNIMRDIKLP